MPTAVITGAYSNTGAAVATELARRGWSIRTLTNRASPPASAMASFPLRFDPDTLDRALAGADAFVNTYWVRFPRGDVTFDTAVRNSRALVQAARAAGVPHFVQVSVSNASEASPLGYYRGKAAVDRLVRESGLSYAIVRPTLIVGPKDVLTNNIAWFLRRFPIFALPAGSGYRLQPVLMTDASRIIADAAEHTSPLEVDAAGPEVVTFGEYVRRLSLAIGARPRFVAVPAGVVLAALQAFGVLLQDTVLTPGELDGLQREMLVSHSAPLGRSSVFEWLREHATGLGREWANDTRTRFAAPG